MSFKYEQATGKLFDENGLVGVGWAGHTVGKNLPSAQAFKDTGPLPQGVYVINDPINGSHLGPLAFPLTPDKANEMFGRADFFIHGASLTNPSMSSDGCIIQGRVVREYVDKKIEGSPIDSPLRQLVVVSGLPLGSPSGPSPPAPAA